MQLKEKILLLEIVFKRKPSLGSADHANDKVPFCLWRFAEPGCKFQHSPDIFMFTAHLAMIDFLRSVFFAKCFRQYFRNYSKCIRDFLT